MGTEATEDMEVTEHELEIQAASEDLGVTEAMGLTPEEPLATEDASQLESAGVTDSLDEQELKGIIESLLYVSIEPLTVEKITSVLAGPPKVVVNNAIRALQQDYDQEGRGLHIVELAGGFAMVTRADCAPWITRLHKVKASAKVSRSAMETLAIIAYKQPIVRAEIEQIRGVETSGVLRTLLDQKLIRMVGRKDIPGRPIMYGTSKVFLQRFGLRDLRDLPPLREFNELGQGDSPDLFSDETLAMFEESTAPEAKATLSEEVHSEESLHEEVGSEGSSSADAISEEAVLEEDENDIQEDTEDDTQDVVEEGSIEEENFDEQPVVAQEGA